MRAPRAHLHRPSPFRLEKRVEGDKNQEAKTNPENPAGGEVCRHRRPVRRWLLRRLGRQQRPPGWRRVRAAQPGWRRRRRRCRRAAGRGAASSPTPAASSSLLLLLLPARQLPPPSSSPSRARTGTRRTPRPPQAPRSWEALKVRCEGGCRGSRRQPPVRELSPCLPRASLGRSPAGSLPGPRAH